jgi:hypothetical protein
MNCMTVCRTLYLSCLQLTLPISPLSLGADFGSHSGTPPLQTDQVRVTYVHSPWDRVLPEKLTDPPVVKEFPIFCGT